MVDWMIQVLYVLKEPTQTLFRAVQIMDQFFMECPDKLQVDDLHLVGVASIRIACKYESLAVISIEDFVLTLTKGKYTPEQINNAEMQILNAIKFDVSMTTLFDACENLLNKIFLHFKDRHESERYAIQMFTNYIAKSIMYSRDFLDNYYNNQELSLSIVKYGIWAANKFYEEEVLQKTLVLIAQMEEFKFLETAGGERQDLEVSEYIQKFSQTFKHLSALQNYDDANGFFTEIFGL